MCDYGRPRNADPAQPPGGCADDSRCAGTYRMNVPFAVASIADPVGNPSDLEPEANYDLDWDKVIEASDCLEDCTLSQCTRTLSDADPTNPDISSCYIIHRYADAPVTCSPFPLQSVNGEMYNIEADNALGVQVDLSGCPKALGRNVVKNTLYVLPQESGKDPEEELHQVIESSEGSPETGAVPAAKKSMFSQVRSFLKYFFTGFSDSEVALSPESASPLLAQVGGEGGTCLERDNWDKECSVGKGTLYNCEIIRGENREGTYCVFEGKKIKFRKDGGEFPGPKTYSVCEEVEGGCVFDERKKCATGGECASGYCYIADNDEKPIKDEDGKPTFCTGTNPCGTEESPGGTCAKSTIKVYPPCCGTARCVHNRCEPVTLNQPRARKPRNAGSGPGLPPVGARNGDDKGDGGGGVKMPPPWGVPIVIPPKKPKDPRQPFWPHVSCTSDGQCDCSSVGWCNACGCSEEMGLCVTTLLACGSSSSVSGPSSSQASSSSSGETESSDSSDSSSSDSSYSIVWISSPSSFSSFSSFSSTPSSSSSSSGDTSSSDSSSSNPLTSCGNGIQELGEQCETGAPCPEDYFCNYLCQCSPLSISSSSSSSVSSASSDSASSVSSSFGSFGSSSVSAVLRYCGNGVTETGEQCDDGNFFFGDGCSRFCILERPAVCGNRVVEIPEECDDGNTVDGDSCSFVCRREFPFPSSLSSFDSSSLPWDVSSSLSFGSVCGNGVMEGAEQCDDGNVREADGCDRQCRRESLVTYASPGCGNGALESGEECDDGNSRDLDGCSGNCFLERGFCGDGVIQRALGEQCEPSLVTPLTFPCGNNCRFLLSFCGNGIVDPGEECDRGPENSGQMDATCRPDCSFGRCGDDIPDSMEQCDDGNLVPGDGCSPFCIKEWGAPVSSVSGGTPGTPGTSGTTELATLVPLQPSSAPRAPVGNTGPATIAVMAAGAAAGMAWMRRKKRK